MQSTLKDGLFVATRPEYVGDGTGRFTANLALQADQVKVMLPQHRQINKAGMEKLQKKQFGTESVEASGNATGISKAKRARLTVYETPSSLSQSLPSIESGLQALVDLTNIADQQI